MDSPTRRTPVRRKIEGRPFGGRPAVSLVLAATLLVGCRTPLGITRDEDAPVQTRALEYTLTPGLFSSLSLSLTFVFRNPTGGTVVIVMCSGETDVRLERLEDGVWEQVQQVGMLCGEETPSVAPGATWAGRVKFSGGRPDCGCIPIYAKGRPEGVFRIVLGAVREPSSNGRLGDRLPIEQRASNRFKVRLP